MLIYDVHNIILAVPLTGGGVVLTEGGISLTGDGLALIGGRASTVFSGGEERGGALPLRGRGV